MGLKFQPLLFSGFVSSSGSGSSATIGGPVVGGTAGSVLFVNPTAILAQDNANLNFNDTTHQLTVGGNLAAATFNGYTPENLANKGVANGYAPLDSGAKIPVAFLPSVVMEYQGAWNPSTNTPTLSDGTGTNGNVYYVSAAFAGPIGGLTDPSMHNFQIGDIVIYSSSVGKWQLTTPAAGVQSVNGLQGVVVLTQGNLTDSSAGADGITVSGGTNAVWGTGTSIAQQAATTSLNGYLTSTNFNTFNNKQPAGNYITALTGDATAAGPGSAALTLATVNANVGSFGGSTSIPNFTVNAKGLITAAGSNVVVAPAGTLTGTTLASNVVSSSLTSVGTLTSLTLASPLAISSGGTGATSTSQNFVFAGPTSGSGAPSFRALVAGDIPSLSGTYANLALSNLASTAVNADINPGTTNTINLGQIANSYLSVSTGLLNITTGATLEGSLTFNKPIPDGTSTDINLFSTAGRTVGVYTSNNGAGNTGTLYLETGNATSGSSGNIILQSGTTTTSGNSGGILLQTGTAVGSRGKIQFKDGSEGTSGQVWTSTDNVGNAHWAATTSGTVTSVALSDGSTSPIYNISGSPVTSTGTLTFTLKSQTANQFFAAPNGSPGQPSFRAIVAADVPTLNQNTTGTASNITASSNSTLTTLSALSLPTTQLTGTLQAAQFPALTGDITTTGSSLATTLATVNGNVGSFGSSTSIPTFTVNGKGLITAASGNAVVAPAGTLSGTTLNSTVVTSSLTSLGAQSVALNMNSHLINNVTDPVSAQDAATKHYVDNATAGINPAVAVQAATTSAANTSGFTYNNGVSGIGATFTGSINTAVTIDGYTFTALNQRLLVKNDTQSPSGAFNGIYYVTQLQTALVPPILTRALDYDQSSDINNTGAIPVINGTVNGTTQWVLTSLVNTVGTDPLTFTQFARNPADYLLKANNLSDIASASAAFNNIDPMTTTGDLIYESAPGVASRLAIGTAGQVLTVSSGVPTWQPAPGTASSFFASSQVTTDSSNLTSTSFATFSNSPAFSFTPAITGTYKIYSSIPLTANNSGSGQSSGMARIFKTSGSGTLLNESQAYVNIVSEINISDSVFIESVYTLTAGTSYVFDIQAQVENSGNNVMVLSGSRAAFYMFAEFIVAGTNNLVSSFFASNQVNTESAAVSSGSFTTFSNSPAFTFTPSVTGTYKVYSSIPSLLDGGDPARGVFRIFNTSGSATLLEESQGINQSTASVHDQVHSAYIQSVYTLTAGTSYVFDIQGAVQTGVNVYCDGVDAPFYMFAELEVSGSSPSPAAVGLIAGLTTNQVPGTGNIVKFDNIIDDTNNAYNTSTGLYTVPSSGRYLICLTVNVNATVDFSVKVNGSTSPPSPPGAFVNTSSFGSGCVSVKVNTNDTIGIYVDTGATIGGPGDTNLSIWKMGN